MAPGRSEAASTNSFTGLDATGPTKAMISSTCGISRTPGYSSLPATTPALNPNLVLIYLDAQLDHLQDRLYQVGALVVGHDAGTASPQRRRTVIAATAGPPDSLEREGDLFIGWIADVLTAISEVAAPDAEGQPRAPIHLVFYDAYTQKILLDGLARHHGRVLATTPLYDFVTQIAAYDSPILTHVEARSGPRRTTRSWPRRCNPSRRGCASPGRRRSSRSSAIACSTLAGCRARRPQTPSRATPTTSARARFSSQMPLEYAYAAWDQLARSGAGGDGYKPYREATSELLRDFRPSGWRRWSTSPATFAGNRETSLGVFAIPDLARLEGKAESLAGALEEFVILERHADMAAWKAAHLPAPERRALVGDALIVRYKDEHQDPEIVAQNMENERRRQLRLDYAAQIDDDGAPRSCTKDEKDETKWSQEGMRVRLGIETKDLETSLHELLALTRTAGRTGRPPASRWTYDSPAAQGPAAAVHAHRTSVALRHSRRHRAACRGGDRPGRSTRPGNRHRKVRLQPLHDPHKFIFGTMSTHDRPLVDGDLYTLGPDPNN